MTAAITPAEGTSAEVHDPGGVLAGGIQVGPEVGQTDAEQPR